MRRSLGSALLPATAARLRLAPRDRVRAVAVAVATVDRRRLIELMRSQRFVKVTIWVIVIAMVVTLLSAALSSLL